MPLIEPARDPVFVVVLNWNGRADTLVCLRSLTTVVAPHLTVVLVDNGCAEFSAAELSALVPNSYYLRSPDNRGFAGGCNLAIRHALNRGAQLVFLLNNDAVVEPDTVAEVARVAAADPTVGVVGAKLLQTHRPNILESAGLRVNLRSGRLYQIGFGEEDTGQYDTGSDVSAVSGCAMLLTQAVCERLGGFDERYFAYLEDVDLCLRARSAGFAVRFAPRARVYHRGKGSTARDQSTLSSYYATRNHLLLMDTHGCGGAAQRSLRRIAVVLFNLAYALRGRPDSMYARLHTVARAVGDYRRDRFGAAPLGGSAY
ncbi:MAG TPA: glycosyltransferase family 2 protein [Candidatus Binatia bacterium]|nr:glycosyltransferase family 2 protein [Candidatus Binatia bacterium]